MAPVNLAEAVVIKRQNLFLLTERDGRVPAGREHPLGLWYRDCRFLSVHELLLDGARPLALQASDGQGAGAVHHVAGAAGSVSLRIERTVDGPTSLRERILVHSHRNDEAPLVLGLRLAADFVPMLAVRGLMPLPRRRPEVSRDGGRLCFAVRGRDGVTRTTTVELATEPASCDLSGGTAALTFAVAPRAGDSHELELRFSVEETGAQPGGHAAPEPTLVRCDDELFQRVLARSLADLEMLRSELDGLSYFAAGVPWFATLFGRDSMIAATQALAFFPSVAGDTLRLLGGLLGRERDDARDEEPGKVLHELRVGEPATLDETPFARYYGSADATPLWLCLLCDQADWSGDLALFRELRPQVEAALGWLQRHGDLDGDGLLEYRRRAPGGLENQGWKDWPGAVCDAAGRRLEPPIALVEVQGYAIRALRGVARLVELEGDRAEADRLRGRARALEAGLGRFWLAEPGSYAIALDAAKRPASGLASNQGHLLWAGVLPGERARRIRDVLMDERMFSGWGIRTLAEGHAGYGPLGYHTGAVWPHDTALIAAGLRRHGFDEDFGVLFEGLLEAASRLGDHRLPELFAGYGRRPGEAPVPYPVACRPQAWAAGAIPYLLATGLGLRPDGLARSLRVVRPLLPRWLERVELEGLRVAGARVDLRFERAGQRVIVADARVDGELELVIDDGTG